MKRQRMSTFRHCGDWGDIVYSLPTIRAAGGGTLLFESAECTREPMSSERMALLIPLLLLQPYISGVREFSGEPVDYCLNDFRTRILADIRQGRRAEKSLADLVLETHGFPSNERDTAWLAVPTPKKMASVVINRTARYQNPTFPWRRVVEKYGDKAVFIGTTSEASEFRETFGENIPFYSTTNFLEAAQVIAGSDLFIGNQSCCYAIAEGLKHRAVLEVFPRVPNCLFFRENCWHGWNGAVFLPEL